MLATTIHKSNTTPHHQSGATTRTAHRSSPTLGDSRTHGRQHPPTQMSRGPVVSKPNSVSGSQAPTKSGTPKSLLSCTRTASTTEDSPSNESLRTPNPHTMWAGRSLVVLLRKEVIQPHLPVRLPCYDFVPIADPTFDGSLPQGVRPPASGVTDFHDVTGGVYKARERIHRSVADLRLLATPTSRGRVADPDPN
jgi:hypothetical protein